MKKILLLIALISFFGIQRSSAVHFAGSDLTYTCLGGNTYLITYSLYRDCSGVTAPTSLYTSFTCSSNSSLNFNTMLTKIPGTGLEITPSCSAVPTHCSNGNGYGIQEYVYQSTVILAACNSWTISIHSCCRNAVTTVSYNNSNSWFSTAQLNNLNAPCNSSPNFTNKPIAVVCSNQSFQFNSGATDPDGDSLVYSFYPIMTNNQTSTVTYLPPYTYTNFLASVTPPGITINSVTSNIRFTPNTVQSTAFGIKVQEYRNINGVPTLIGTVYRDMQLKIVQCNNHVPIISGIDTNILGSFSPDDTLYSITRCLSDDSIKFNIYGFDADSFNPTKFGNPEKFSIKLNNAIDGAKFKTYNNGTDSAYATFAWLPTTNDINKLRYFSANIQDEACPYNSSNAFTYSILVQGLAVDIGSDTLLCMGEDLRIKATTATSITNYIWQMDGLPTGTPLSQDSFIFNSTNYNIGTHILSLEINDSSIICPGIDKIAIKVAYLPHIHGTFRDTSICNNQLLTIDAGLGQQYLWTDFYGTPLWHKRYFSTTVGGPYIITVDGDSNSRCVDSDTFTVFSLPSPPLFYLGNDTTISPSQSITLKMPVGMPSYLWSTGATTQSITIDNSFNWINRIVGSIFLPNTCYSSDTIYVYIGSVGMEEDSDSPLRIYPNPIHNILNIELNKSYYESKIEILDINAKTIISTKFSGQFYELKSLEHLANGIYFLKLQNEELNIFLRFVKE